MRESDEVKYLSSVDKTLSELRIRLLGLNTRFQSLLPADMLKAPPEQQAAHLTERFLFCLAAQAGCWDAVLVKARPWFYDLFFYTIKHLPQEERTFQSLMKLDALDQPVRKILFSDRGLPNTCAATETHSPVSREQLELAVLNMLLSNRSSWVDKPLLAHVKQALRAKI